MQAPWWERGVIYQIYPRSFQDSDADGVGDLAGIELRLDYLAELGIDAIWLSPIYPSPMADFGYDIADYCDIDPMFGDLAGFDRLLAAVHARGLRLLLDFVPNHSSDQHPWFVESRGSRENPKRDWYIWRDPAPDGRPPNNWISDFGGSSWEWDETTGQYYLHAFLPAKPDLNWRNPEVREAMMAVLRFWSDRGVDGFRIDVLWHIIKAEVLPDNPINAHWTPDCTQRDRLIQLYSTDQPEAHAISAEFRALVDRYGDRVLIGEICLPNDRLARWYGTPDRPQMHLPFNFQLIENAWDAASLRRTIAAYEASLPRFGWPNWVIGSHDAPRIAARVGEAQARIAAMLLLTLRGTPTLYQGDEIGIGEVQIAPIGCATHRTCVSLAWGSVAIVRAHRYRGMLRPMRGSALSIPGFRSTKTGACATLRHRIGTAPHFCLSTDLCSRCGDHTTHSQSAQSRSLTRRRTCSPTNGDMPASAC